MDYTLYIFRKWTKNEKKVWTKPFTFFENGPKMRKKHGLTHLHFYRKWTENEKKR